MTTNMFFPCESGRNENILFLAKPIVPFFQDPVPEGEELPDDPEILVAIETRCTMALTVELGLSCDETQEFVVAREAAISSCIMAAQVRPIKIPLLDASSACCN